MSSVFAPVFAALHAKAFPLEPWDEASFATMLAQPGCQGFLDPRGGFLLLRIVLDEAEIITIGTILPRQGIATALMAQAIAAARAAGVKTIHLEVAENNTAARALYAAQNFTRTGRRNAYYADGSAALTLALDLG
jgi:ribosomal-protein-alanine N-acetyltransferase